MVYIAATPFGHGVSVLPEEESVADMIGKYFFQHKSPGGDGSSTRRGSVESWEDTEATPPIDLNTSLAEERRLHQHVTLEMERRLSEAKQSVLRCQLLLLPRHMTTRIGHHILRASADEPCGLRGASIKLFVENKDGLKHVGSVQPDPAVTPTFELSVVFKEDSWTPLMHILGSSKVLKLKAEYRLVKRKLYSSASPVVHEFS